MLLPFDGLRWSATGTYALRFALPSRPPRDSAVACVYQSRDRDAHAVLKACDTPYGQALYSTGRGSRELVLEALTTSAARGIDHYMLYGRPVLL